MNRVESKNHDVSCDEEDKLLREDTKLSTTKFDEEQDYFLIPDTEDGTMIVGSKFMAKKFFGSTTILMDGTFRTAPKEYYQNYILWFLVEDKTESDTINRTKAFPAIYFIMKSASQKKRTKKHLMS